MVNTSASQALREYLQWEHANVYTGMDDDMADRCDDWIANLTDKEITDLVLACFHEGI